MFIGDKILSHYYHIYYIKFGFGIVFSDEIYLYSISGLNYEQR